MSKWQPITGPLPAPTSSLDRLEVYDPKFQVGWPYATYHPQAAPQEWLVSNKFVERAIEAGALYYIHTLPDPQNQ